MVDEARVTALLHRLRTELDAIARLRMADLEAFRAAVATRLAGEGSSGGAGPTVS